MSLFWECDRCHKKIIFWKETYGGICYKCKLEVDAEIAAQKAKEEAERAEAERLRLYHQEQRVCDLTQRIKSLPPLHDWNLSICEKFAEELPCIQNTLEEFIKDPCTKELQDIFINKYYKEIKYTRIPDLYYSTIERRIGEADFNIFSELYNATISIKYDSNYFKNRLINVKNSIDNIKYAEIIIEESGTPTDNSDISYDFTSVTGRNKIEKIKDFIAIDTETTGLNSSVNEIIQLSAVRFENFLPVEAWSTYIKPRKGINPKAEEINHIHESDVREAPYKEQIYNSFSRFIDNGLPLVGYNMEFDMRFLLNQGFNVFKRKHRIFDAYDLAERSISYGVKSNYKLSTVANALGYDFLNNYHDSFCDCIATGLVFADCASIQIESRTTTGIRAN